MGTITILPETTKTPITLIGNRAGICWGADVTNAEKNYKRGVDCIKSGHGRTFEFPDVHMVIDGFSARVMREYERHVGGLSPWLQASTRYINYNDFDIIVPKSIKSNGDATITYNQAVKNIRKALSELNDLGIPREDLANLLPLGMTTKIACKHNFRNLVDMSHQRLCTRAYWEYRQLFRDIIEALENYSDEWKILVQMMKPKCEVYGYCTEEKSCGRVLKKESKNINL